MAIEKKAIASVSLNFHSTYPNTVLFIPENTPEIIAKCVRAAIEQKDIYYLIKCMSGYRIKCSFSSAYHPAVLTDYEKDDWSTRYELGVIFTKEDAVKRVMSLYEKEGV